MTISATLSTERSEPVDVVASLDVYPESAPSSRRQVGYWNVRCTVAAGRPVHLEFALAPPECTVSDGDGRPLELDSRHDGGLREDGLHVLWLTVYTAEGAVLARRGRYAVLSWDGGGLATPDSVTAAALLRLHWAEAHRRNPPLWAPDHLTHDAITTAMARFASTFPADGGTRVLDVGCGGKPYLPHWRGRVAAYVGLDIVDGPAVDVVHAAESLPFADGEFDACVSSQVLEHVDEPAAVIEEMRRVLRPGGRVLLAAPCMWEVHCTPDHWRFVEGGLRRLFRRYVSVDVVPCGNSLQGLIQTGELLLWRSLPRVPTRAKQRLCAAVNRAVMPRAARSADVRLPANYLVHATR